MRLWWIWVVCGVLAGCAGTPERGRAEAYRLDSLTAGCRVNPARCAQTGVEALVPGTQGARVLASVGTAGSAVLRVLTDEQRDLVERALVECADAARSAVLVDLLDGKSPTREQCSNEVEKDAQGKPVTLAMKLGTEMHKVALECTRERLDMLRTGGFSLEPRYGYNPQTKKWEFWSEEAVRSLRRQGRGGELKGSLVPDVLIHSGDPSKGLAVYDFKFPCMSIDEPASWRQYPPEPPYKGRTQQQLYMDALGLTNRPAIIQPRRGVIR